MLAAKKLADEMGGVDRVKAAIDALSKLQQLLVTDSAVYVQPAHSTD